LCFILAPDGRVAPNFDILKMRQQLESGKKTSSSDEQE
jgi:hypothetical protein